MKYQYLVEPFDVLFFRNNKAFDFGDWYSEGFFPPMPSTFQGFVRTSILLRYNLISNGKVNYKQAEKLIGDHKEFPLDLRGPFLLNTASNRHFYFVTPKDIVKEKENNGHHARQIRLSDQPIGSDLGTLYYAAESGKYRLLHFEQPFIDGEAFAAYRRTGSFCVNEDKAVFTEEHYGIALKDNKQVEEHRFYLTPYQRLNQQVALYFELKSHQEIKDLNNQYSRLGSEGRGAVIQATDQRLNLKMPENFYEELAQAGRFKMIFLQPGILPEDLNIFDIQGNITIGNLNLKLLYAAMDYNLKISGVDFKQTSTNPAGHKNLKKDNYRLKPMVNALPACSVFYFGILNNDQQETARRLKELDDSKIPNGNYSAMGYNHIVLGKII